MKALMSCTLGLLLAAAMPLQAASVDPYLPADTEMVVSLNMKQARDSAFVKEVLLKPIKEAMQRDANTTLWLTALHLDPFKDIDHILITSSGTDDAKGLIIARGTFDANRFASTLPLMVKQGKIKEHGTGKIHIYEAVDPRRPTYFCLVDKQTLLLGPDMQYLEEALGGKAGKSDNKTSKGTKPDKGKTDKPKTGKGTKGEKGTDKAGKTDKGKGTKKDKDNTSKGKAGLAKELRNLIQKCDAKQTMWVAGVPSDTTKKRLASNPDEAKITLGLKSFQGGFTITNSFQGKVALQVDNPKNAEDLRKMLDGFKSLLKLSKKPSADTKFMDGLLKGVSITSSKDIVTVKVTISSKQMQEALKDLK